MVCWSRTADLRSGSLSDIARVADCGERSQHCAAESGLSHVSWQHRWRELHSCSQRSSLRTCLKKLLTLSVGNTLKHAQSSAGSPQIVFGSDCPEETAASQLMRTLCDWIGQHRKTGLLRVLMALQQCVCREQPNITFKSIWSVLYLPQASNYCIHTSRHFPAFLRFLQCLVKATHWIHSTTSNLWQPVILICVAFATLTWNTSSNAAAAAKKKACWSTPSNLLCFVQPSNERRFITWTQTYFKSFKKLFDSQSDMNFAFRCFY